MRQEFPTDLVSFCSSVGILFFSTEQDAKVLSFFRQQMVTEDR
jgi:hypothetical protein